MLIDAKIYNDGSHYIAIPKTTALSKRGRTREEDEIKYVLANEEESIEDNNKAIENDIVEDESFVEESEGVELNAKIEVSKVVKSVNRLKDSFNQAYKESLELRKSKRRDYIVDKLITFFNSKEKCEEYVDKKLGKINRNMIIRKMRFCRKAYMNNFNYFVTFTYDEALHTEESFKKKLSQSLSNFHKRRGWCYMGVWERSKVGRLHFHGLLYIPDNEMVGELIRKRDYNLNSHKMQVTIQNTFFNEKFGRSDFEEIDKEYMKVGNVLAYILKYISKTGEKLVYSRGVPMYVRSDILDEDMIAKMVDEEYHNVKYVLSDKFMCIDDGELLGEISDDVKTKMRACNS